jgi:hypothetical protein
MAGVTVLAGVAAAVTVPPEGVTTTVFTPLTGGGVIGAFVGPLGTLTQPGSLIVWVHTGCAPATAGTDNSDAAATHEPTTALLIHFMVSYFP